MPPPPLERERAVPSSTPNALYVAFVLAAHRAVHAEWIPETRARQAAVRLREAAEAEVRELAGMSERDYAAAKRAAATDSSGGRMRVLELEAAADLLRCVLAVVDLEGGRETYGAPPRARARARVPVLTVIDRGQGGFAVPSSQSHSQTPRSASGSPRSASESPRSPRSRSPERSRGGGVDMCVHRVPGDGNCLFYAAAQAEAMADGGAWLAARDMKARAAVLRARVAAYVRARGEVPAPPPAWALDTDAYRDWDDYSRAMGTPARPGEDDPAHKKWGSVAEVEALARVLGRAVLVLYRQDGTLAHRAAPGSAVSSALHLVFQDGNHYQVLHPPRGAGRCPPGEAKLRTRVD